ncbi:hypothetical protein LCGC14_1943330 [marine sediment metagenome]|uniref:Uncharacterized protein n=1 Tax=marine sediment metagenome TaxID=412755 RepID=A0A0F9HXZ1_9ZZZZ
MNWAKVFYKIMKCVMFVLMGACAIIIIGASVLVLYHGIDSGILTWVSAPQWLWENFNTVYILIGSMTSGSLLYFFMDSLDKDEKYKKKSESEKSDTMSGLMVVVMFTFILWPMIWSYMCASIAHSGYKKLNKETKND